MALCVFDCLAERPQWPRGMLIGFATAVKLLPAIFIPYLWLSGRRRAAIVAAATAVGSTLVTAVVLPSDSHAFWFSRVFDSSRVGNNAYFSNQSIHGILLRADVPAVWIVGAAAVAVVGLIGAARCSRAGDELRGIVVTGLVGVLISPVSWIHHLVWVVPALLLVLGAATNRRRVWAVFAAALLLALRVPYIWSSVPVLRDSYGLLCLALLTTLLFLRPPTPDRASLAAKTGSS
jgi:alpha-1,2-mannosyltransferase